MHVRLMTFCINWCQSACVGKRKKKKIQQTCFISFFKFYSSPVWVPDQLLHQIHTNPE